jgi:hypothetical protein
MCLMHNVPRSNTSGSSKWIDSQKKYLSNPPGQYIRNPVRTGIVALYTRIIYFLKNAMRQMFMRQIVADAISKFQKITRQMLCDNVPKMTSL